jgi:cysteine desulfurase
MNHIYLDHNATTPIHPAAMQAMDRCHAQGHANAASRHRPGQRARTLLEDARQRIAQLLGAEPTGAQPDRLIFTSSATEANNLAVLGIARAGRPDTGRIVVSAMEHNSVIEPAEQLMEQGWDYVGLAVSGDGVVRSELLPGLIAGSTRLVCVTLGSHETGVLQPVAGLAAICNLAGIPLHTDAAQVAGKLPVAFRRLGVASMSIAAHKFGGPLGIGALIVRHGVPRRSLMFGGPHQWGLRPGTEPLGLAMGMLAALEVRQRNQQAHAERMTTLRDRFERGLKAGAPDVIVHGGGAPRLPNTSNVAFPAAGGQALLMALDTAGVACSAGSACSSGSTEPSPALRAMGLPGEIVSRSLRFSLGVTTTEAEINEAVSRILRVYAGLAGS